MSEPYTLKKTVNEVVLGALNDDNGISYRLHQAISYNPFFPDDEQFDDWISALKSGKKIVNPLSPDEELRNKYIKTYDDNWANKQYREGYSDGMCDCLTTVAKKHPDLKDWLKGDDDNA